LRRAGVAVVAAVVALVLAAGALVFAQRYVDHPGSGDDEVLRAMRRRYSAAQYVAKLEPLGDFNLTADVIVGFPAESEDAFARTLNFLTQHLRLAGPTR